MRILGIIPLIIAATAATAVAVAPSAAAATGVGLLGPGGKLPVGQRTYHLADTGRADRWQPDQRRELMVSLWYPAIPVGKRAEYMTAAESTAAVRGLRLDLPDDALQKVKVHSYRDAPPLPKSKGWPLVVLSPGMGNSRTTLTTLAEELASRGFVVAGIDHAYEAQNVEFPGGRLLPCKGCSGNPDIWAEALAERALDVKFVLDDVLTNRPVRIDRSRIGMAGHSAGGVATIHSLAGDRRFKAGVSMDGPIYRPLAVAKPFALLTSPIGEQGWAGLWDAAWPSLTGWKERRLLPQTGHSSSNDNGYLAVALGQKDKIPANVWSNLYGTGDPVASVKFFRDYLTGFFQARL
ncbi:alpha/beta hydrolase family protein [Kibdelosporangium phytohabitans]|uniref:Acetylhydrolase n=1 Tax=Kibdelosporangium phytohabitans TaxID=860235 RepID=A0A0N7F5X6_9PSEU|nr:hypothetical protein [Kibdelosporangium phytohabitans]ALG15455.1 hypothetical protein AOZ06_41285 [Kibdelosporangium phytohabitans]MBE1464034.1 putative esterase [Kibdelosporangium phytohabitans]